MKEFIACKINPVPKPCYFIEKLTPAQIFSSEFCKITSFLQNTPGDHFFKYKGVFQTFSDI